VAIQTGSTYIPDSMTDNHYNSDDKPEVFDQGEIAESVKEHRTTTGNRDISTKTGNSHTTGTTTGSVEIPTASPGFSTMASPNKVLTSDCDNGREPEMAMWPPKPEMLIYLWNYGR